MRRLAQLGAARSTKLLNWRRTVRWMKLPLRRVRHAPPACATLRCATKLEPLIFQNVVDGKKDRNYYSIYFFNKQILFDTGSVHEIQPQGQSRSVVYHLYLILDIKPQFIRNIIFLHLLSM